MIDLTQRESLVLGTLVENFIQTAAPIGSRFLSKKIKQKLSPATIRNVMCDLAEKGLISQPHTSAGRIPTDEGYRVFVDILMRHITLTPPEKKAVQVKLASLSRDQDLILTRSSQVLSEISRQLGVVLAPKFEKGIFTKLELIHLAEKRILVVISIESGLVRTITIELKTEIPANKLEETARILNQRLHGLSLGEIRDSIGKRMDDVSEGDIGLINLFVETADTVFSLDEEDGVHVEGAHYMVGLPEFADVKRTQLMLDLIENKRNLIVHVLNDYRLEEYPLVLIGRENNEKLMRDYSLVTAKYKVGNISGVLGVIGPTRMQYAKMIALVEYVAQSVTSAFGPKD